MIRTALALALLAPCSARADADVPAAEGLFQRAMQHVEAGRWAEACPLLEESVRLDYGAAAEFRLAECFERTGRIASAWARYTNVAHVSRLAAQLDRALIAARRVKELAPRLPYLMIAVPGAVEATAGLVVTRGDIQVGPPQWGVPVPVDPGEHRVEARATGCAPFTQLARVAEGQRVRVDIPPLACAPPPVARPSPAAAPIVASSAAAPPRASWRWGVGVTAGASGAAALAVGAVLGVVAKGDYDAAVGASCDAEGCTRAGVTAIDDARALGDVGTGVAVAGIAAMVSGAALLLWALGSEGG